MRIRVLLFAGLRERAGASSIELELPDGATVQAAIEKSMTATPRPWTPRTTLMAAVNGEYAPSQHGLANGDELALIPPVSGGVESGVDSATSGYVEITSEPLDPADYTSRVKAAADGAIVAFLGVTRDHNEGRRVLHLEYEAYRPMADRKIAELIGEMKARWPIDRVAVGHRIGRVDIGETSMVVAVSSAHRKPAFEAALYFVDRLKQVVPIWKKEFFQGGEVWIGDAEHPNYS